MITTLKILKYPFGQCVPWVWSSNINTGIWIHWTGAGGLDYWSGALKHWSHSNVSLFCTLPDWKLTWNVRNWLKHWNLVHRNISSIAKFKRFSLGDSFIHALIQRFQSSEFRYPINITQYYNGSSNCPASLNFSTAWGVADPVEVLFVLDIQDIQ